MSLDGVYARAEAVTQRSLDNGYPNFAIINRIYHQHKVFPCSNDYPDARAVAKSFLFYVNTDDPNVTSRSDISSLSILVFILCAVVSYIPMEQSNDAVVERLIDLLS